MWNINEDILYNKLIFIIKYIFQNNPKKIIDLSYLGLLLKQEFKRRNIIITFNHKIRNINYYIKKKYHNLSSFMNQNINQILM